MAPTSVHNFHEMCRICMDKGRLLPIFGAPLRAGAVTKITNDHSDSIMKYADVRLQKDDGLPQKMCYGCLFLLKSAIQFKTTCEKSDKALNKMFQDEYFKKNDKHKIEEWSELGKLFVFKQETNHSIEEADKAELSTDSFDKEIDCIMSGTLGEKRNIEIDDCTAGFLERDDNSFVLTVPSKDLEDVKMNDLVFVKDECISGVVMNNGVHINGENNKGGNENVKDSEFAGDNTFSDTEYVKTSDSAAVNKKKSKRRKYSPDERVYLQILQRSKRTRKMRNKRDNESEFKSIADKMNSTGICQENEKTLVLQRLVVSSVRQQRSKIVDHQFREQSRSLFRPVQGPKKLLQCTICDMVVKVGSAHNHSQRHLGYKIICELCGKGFASHFGLEQHLMTRHGKEKNLTCQYCSYRTGNRFELRVHERSHTGERPFVCDLCGKSFFRRLCMVKHIMLHTQIKRHTCQVCPKSYVHLSDLKAHVNAVHDRRYVYKCELCDLSYAKGNSVRKHLIAQHSIPREQQGRILRVNLC